MKINADIDVDSVSITVVYILQPFCSFMPSPTDPALLLYWLLNHASQFLQQTESAMADHDPQIALTLTPAKRVSVHGGLE